LETNFQAILQEKEAHVEELT